MAIGKAFVDVGSSQQVDLYFFSRTYCVPETKGAEKNQANKLNSSKNSCWLFGLLIALARANRALSLGVMNHNLQ